MKLNVVIIQSIPIAFLVLFSVSISSQTTKQPQNQPIELPQFIVTGQDVSNIEAATKQNPVPPRPLAPFLLDSLNPLRKITLPSLHLDSLPSYDGGYSVRNGYVDASIGIYLTPSLDAGWVFPGDHSSVNASVSIEGSPGWLPETQYIIMDARGDGFVELNPGKLWLEKSSLSMAGRVNTSSYRLFGAQTIGDRSVSNLSLAGLLLGENGNGPVNASVSVRSLHVSTESESVPDQEFAVGVSFTMQELSYKPRLSLGGSLRRFGESAYPRTDLDVLVNFPINDYTAKLSGGFSAASTNGSQVRMAPQAMFGVERFLSQDWTIGATVRTGLKDQSFQQILNESPYSATDVVIDYCWDVFNIGAMFMYHPTTHTQVRGDIGVGQSKRIPVRLRDSTGYIGIQYLDAAWMKSRFELFSRISSADHVYADGLLQLFMPSADSVNRLPGIPTISVGLGYVRDITKELKGDLSMRFVTARYANTGVEPLLPAYTDLHIGVKYTLSADMAAYLRIHNLLNSKIVLFEGYTERGIFAQLGINWSL